MTLPARSSRKQRAAVASELVKTAACSANGVLFAASMAWSKRVEGLDEDHRGEDLGAVQGQIVTDARQHGGRDDRAVAGAAGMQRGPLGYRLGDSLLDPDRRGLVDQRPDAGRVVHRIAQAESGRLGGQRLGELIMEVTVDEDALDRVAALAVVREPAGQALAEGERDVGIGADQVG